MSTFAIVMGSLGSKHKVVFSLPAIEQEHLTGLDVKAAIYERCGVEVCYQILKYNGLFDDECELKDSDIVVDVTFGAEAEFLLQFVYGYKPPFSQMPEGPPIYLGGDSTEADNTAPVVLEVLPALLPPVEYCVTIGGTATTTTIGSVVNTLFPGNTTHYSEVVTSVRGKVVVSDSTSHVVYPFVFRAGGKDVRVTWAAELRERLAASIHPVTLGRDVYRSAIEALDDTPSPSSSVTWDLIISISGREASQ